MHNNPNILLIGSQTAENNKFKNILESHQLNVICTTNPETYYGEPHVVQPDLLIVDVGVDSIEYDILKIERFLEQKAYTNIPFYVLSSDPLLENRIDSLHRGAIDYIQKPFPILELVYKVKNLIRFRELVRTNSFHLPIDVSTLQNEDQLFLNKFIQYINMHLKEEFTFEDVARHCLLSRSKLDKLTRRLTGKSPSQFVREYRLEIAVQLMKQGVKSMKQISQETGFTSLSYFSISFKNWKGVGPKSYLYGINSTVA